MALCKNVLQEDDILILYSYLLYSVTFSFRLKFRTHNSRKITKYGVLVRMVCETVSGYICNMEIYSAEGKKLEDTVLSLLNKNLGQNHHIYQDNFYNSVRLAETLLDMKVRVCGTMRVNRGIPRDLERGRQALEKGAVSVPEKT